MKELRPEIHLVRGKVEKGMNFGKHEHMKTIIHGKERTEVSETEVVVDISSLKLKGKGNDKEREFQFPFCYQKTQPNKKNTTTTNQIKQEKKRKKEDLVCRKSPLIISLPAKLDQRKKKKKSLSKCLERNY